MINSHPNDNLIKAFVEGMLPSADALLVSAHCDMCSQCLHKTRIFTDNAAKDVFATHDDVDSNIMREYVSMFESITFDDTLLDSIHTEHKPRYVTIEGRSFALPATLARFADSVGEWTHLVGKLWQASVDIGGDHCAHFIFMEKGASVPEHTHKGNELTLVIQGQFADGITSYSSGDFIALNEKHTHSPTAQRHEGCLVFTILDEPLHFTSDWAQLVNPLSKLYFKGR